MLTKFTNKKVSLKSNHQENVHQNVLESNLVSVQFLSISLRRSASCLFAAQALPNTPTSFQPVLRGNPNKAGRRKSAGRLTQTTAGGAQSLPAAGSASCPQEALQAVRPACCWPLVPQGEERARASCLQHTQAPRSQSLRHSMPTLVTALSAT